MREMPQTSDDSIFAYGDGACLNRLHPVEYAKTNVCVDGARSLRIYFMSTGLFKKCTLRLMTLESSTLYQRPSTCFLTLCVFTGARLSIYLKLYITPCILKRGYLPQIIHNKMYTGARLFT